MMNMQAGELHPLETKGKEHYAAKNYLQAADAFSQAAEEYARKGNTLQAAEMKNNQAVSLLQAREPQQALDAVLNTAAIFERAGEPLKHAMALANEATVLKELNQNPEAIEKYSQAAALFKELDQPEMLLQTMQSVSSLKLKSRNLPGALFSMQQGLEGLKNPSFRQKILLGILKIPQRLLRK